MRCLIQGQNSAMAVVRNKWDKMYVDASFGGWEVSNKGPSLIKKICPRSIQCMIGKTHCGKKGSREMIRIMTQIRMPSEKICQTTWLGFSLKQLAKTISQGLDLLDQKGTSPRFLALPQQNQNINTLLTQSKWANRRIYSSCTCSQILMHLFQGSLRAGV